MEGSSNDWSYYLREKSSNVLHELARIAETVGKKDALSRMEVLDIRSSLSSALYDMAKIVSLSAGYLQDGPEAGDVQTAILRSPHDGLEEFLYEIGLIAETRRMREAREACELLHPILALLDGPRGENRTMIHGLLEGYRGGLTVVRALIGLTEQVSNGEIVWEEYCKQSRGLIAEHQCEAT